MIFHFAWRYLKGKKSAQAIQIIAWISVMAMAVGCAALMIVLSVFNGFEFFIKDLYSNFYPALKITAVEGKTFEDDELFIKKLQAIQEVQQVSKCLEEKMLLSFNENQVVATIKGIDSNYDKVTNLSSKLMEGDMDIQASGDITPIVLGIGLSNRLGVSVSTGMPIKAYAFRGQSSMSNPTEAYQSQLLSVQGLYMLQEEIDNQYAFSSLASLQAFSEKSNQLSSIEIALDPQSTVSEIKQQIQDFLPAGKLKIESRYEQNKTLYFILSSERWFVFSFLTLILFIASFNMIGSLSMLVMEKQKDITILKAMGMPKLTIGKIFLTTGLFLAGFGATIGTIVALSVCFIQQKFGIVKLGGNGSFLVEAYPVKIIPSDILLVFSTVMLIGILASIFPAWKAANKPIELRVK